MDDFLARYLSYTSLTEVPTFFHRWCAMSGVAAVLGRNYQFQHGHFLLNPNMYSMLIGEPGTRKSTAIKMFKTILKGAGYTTMAAEKTSKEKFLIDLSGMDTEYDSKGKVVSADTLIDTNLWGTSNEEDVASKPPAEVFIMADELNDFLGNGNIEFISMLGSLWDFNGVYDNRIKNGKSVYINNPTINILAGNTPTGFSLAFPPEIIGQGFFSRILLVYAEPTGKKITFPKPPSAAHTKEVVDMLVRIKNEVYGVAVLTPAAEELFEHIYTTHQDIEDVRFKNYASRRLTHLFKLCLVMSACRLSTVIDTCDVVYANTVLTHAEHLMPKALGEFGKSKNSDVSHKIIQLLESSNKVLTIRDLFKLVHNDLTKKTDLGEILMNLSEADKIQRVEGGFLVKKKVFVQENTRSLNYELLTADERAMR